MTGSHFGIVPRRVARLRLPRRALNVLIAIASRANRDRITPPLSRDDIANEVGIDRSKVRLCVRLLEAEGVLELVVRGGGRERANVYRIIPDEEASAPLNGAVSGSETGTGNGAVSGSKTGPFQALNGAAAGPPTESTDITEPPLRGGRARERGLSGSRSGSVGRQPALLLPLNGRRSLEDYQPGSEFVAWAREESPGVNPLDPIIIGQFKDWYLSRGPELKDFNAAYRKWLRDEPKFARQRSRHRGSEGSNMGGSMLDGALDELRKAEAING
jgi:hypothetical protein